MLLGYCLSDFALVPVAPIITGIAFVFKFHVHCFSIVRFIYIYVYILFSLLFLDQFFPLNIRVFILKYHGL